jgi:hypothetical protein
MGPARKRMLDEICFDYNAKDKEDEKKWNMQLKKLRDYYGKNGHCELFWAVDRFAFILNTPTNTSTCFSPLIAGHVPQGKLGEWVDNQLACFKDCNMDPERQRMLDEIGFDFNPKDKTIEENCNLQFKRLQDYYGKHGHCELFWAVDRFTFILNTPTNTSTCFSS